MKTLAAQAQNYAVLAKKKREVQAMLDNLNETLAQHEAELLARFGDEGVQSVKIKTDEGSFTVFPRRELWANILDKPTLFSGLKATGYADLVAETVSTQKLTALCREIDAAGGAIPKQWAAAVQVTEKYRLSVRKANGS